MSSSPLVGMTDRSSSNPLKSLERVKGIEPSSSAWKAPAAVVLSMPILTNRLFSGPLNPNGYQPLSE